MSRGNYHKSFKLVSAVGPGSKCFNNLFCITHCDKIESSVECCSSAVSRQKVLAHVAHVSVYRCTMGYKELHRLWEVWLYLFLFHFRYQGMRATFKTTDVKCFTNILTIHYNNCTALIEHHLNKSKCKIETHWWWNIYNVKYPSKTKV